MIRVMTLTERNAGKEKRVRRKKSIKLCMYN
jgi:hypothetical protein